jgi:hypothetical protein
MKKFIDDLYYKHSSKIIWGLLAFQTLVIAIVSYN